MLRRILIGISCVLISALVPAQKPVKKKPAKQIIEKKGTDSLDLRLVLVGDAGSLIAGRPSVLNSMKKHFKFDDKTTVLFLGDNLYDYGLPDETYQHYTQIVAALDSQINLIKGTKAKAIMIPGNHDWANGAPQGYESVVRQQQYVDRFSSQNLDFLPKEGCPGPVEVDLSKNVVLVVMDSQWWLQREDKPGIESDCNTKTEDDVINELKDILNKNFNKLIILAMHHPFKSNGPHGGYYTWKQHVFPFTDINSKLLVPLPVLGSIYPITRSVFGSPQDIKNPFYTNMIAKVMGAVKSHPNVIFVSGHEHNLQYIKDSSYNYIISGAGCKTNRVSKGRKAEFAEASLGFATLDIYKNKTVGLNFYIVDEKRQDSLTQKYSDRILDFSKLPPLEKKDAVTPEFVYKDLVIAPASEQYKKVSKLKAWFNGSNYRKEWSAPIGLKVFNINKEKGGFKIDGLGGGNQTKSLKLIDKKGEEWALRTIDKDPEKAIPENFRNTFASAVVQDMISASHPYAPLPAAALAKDAGIIATAPEFFFVPDDPSLGYYRPLFADKVCMLEKKEPNGKKDNKSTYKVMDKMREDNEHTVDQNKVLNARLLDMLLGDWDRHFDQWRWATDDTGKGKIYYPMPKDRDQAFFYSDGLLVKFLERRMPFLRGLSQRMKKLSDLNMVAKDFDRMFLNSISKETWDSITVRFVNKMTDSAIHKAVLDLPADIYSIRGEKIEKKLVSRRKQLRSKSMGYYKFLSKEVVVTGSNNDELYKVKNNNNDLEITGYVYDRESDSSFVTFHRIFNPSETKEVRIFGFNGNDKFEIDSAAKSKILIRFIGGKGNDTFLIKSNVRTHLYDVTTEKNYGEGNPRSRTHFSADPEINKYELKSYQYPVKSFPRIAIGYNLDDKFMIGGGFLFRSYKFHREPFANEHRFTALFALVQKGAQFKYNGTFNKLIAGNDILVSAKLNIPGINNFYGIGNETKATEPKKYYLARYREASAEVLIRKVKFDKLALYAGPSFYQYWNRLYHNDGKILGTPSLAGLDSVDVYTSHAYLGAKAGIHLNNLNSEIFPTRGIDWANNFTWQEGVNGTKNRLAKLESDMTVYASLKIPARVTGVIKLGGGKIFTDSTKFFQYLTLGQNNSLRGFRKNRYAGDGLLYGSLELRIKVLEGHSYVFPGQVGLIVFNDVGRVWKRGESSNRWHYSYGGGLYFVPFNTAILSVAIGKSEDQNVFNISIGTKFNFTF